MERFLIIVVLLFLTENFQCCAVQTNVAEVTSNGMQEELQELMAPLMPLSEQPAIYESLFNQRKFRSEFDGKRAAQYIERKQLPWFSCLSLTMVLAVITLIRLFPPAPLKSFPILSVRSKEELLREINQLVNAAPSVETDFSTCCLKLDHLVREYLQEQYQIPLQRYTTEEFLAHCLINQALDDVSKLKILLFLQCMDHAKFANQSTTKSDYLEAVDKVKPILN